MKNFALMIAGKSPSEQLAILDQHRHSNNLPFCDLVKIGQKINDLRQQIETSPIQKHNVQGVTNSIELLTAQNRLDEAIEQFEHIYTMTDEVTPEESRYLQFLWKRIEEKRDNLSKNKSSSQGEAYTLLNKLKIYFASNNIRKASKVANTITEKYHSCLEGQDFETFVQIVSELKIEDSSAQDQQPSDSKQCMRCKELEEQLQSIQHQKEAAPSQDYTLPAYILAALYLDNSDYGLSGDTINLFKNKAITSGKRFNDNLVSEIANIILQNTEACFSPYYQLIEESKNE